MVAQHSDGVRSVPRVALLSPVADPQVVTWTAMGGFDVYILDCEHGPLTIADVHDVCRTGRAAGVEVWVRVPQADRHWIGQSLDAGATGLLVPHVNTATDVERLVEYARYPPRGNRGIAGVAGNGYGTRALDDVDASISLWIQLEEPLAVDEADALLSAGDIQGTLLGPTDLKGRLPGSPADKEMQFWKLTGRTFASARRARRSFGVVVGGPEGVTEHRSRGFPPDLVVVGARFEVVSRLSSTAGAIRALP